MRRSRRASRAAGCARSPRSAKCAESGRRRRRLPRARSPPCDRRRRWQSQLLADAISRPGTSCPRRRACSPITHGASAPRVGGRFTRQRRIQERRQERPPLDLARTHELRYRKNPRRRPIRANVGGLGCACRFLFGADPGHDRMSGPEIDAHDALPAASSAGSRRGSWETVTVGIGSALQKQRPSHTGGPAGEARICPQVDDASAHRSLAHDHGVALHKSSSSRVKSTARSQPDHVEAPKTEARICGPVSVPSNPSARHSR